MLSGEEDSMVLAKANLEEMTIADLIEAMKGMEKGSDAQNYIMTEKISFPAIKIKFKGCRWELQAAREQLSIMLNNLGFGKGRTIKLREASHESEGCPDEHSFVAFEHPSYANLTTASEVIEGILSFHGFDAMSYPYIEGSFRYALRKKYACEHFPKKVRHTVRIGV